MILAPIYKKHLFFRNDDVAGLNENLVNLIDIFVSHKVPIHLSVIPEKLTKECKDYLVNKMKMHGNIIEIGQHGFSHENYSKSKSNFGKYEFGKERSYKQQFHDIVKGRGILRKHFKKKIDVFIPPWNGFDENAFRILVDQGFRAISADRRRVKVGNYNGLEDLSVSIDYNKRNNAGGWLIEKNVEIIKKIRSVKDLKIGILLHHNAFNSQKEFRQLDKFLKFVKGDKSLECIFLSEPLRLKRSEDIINRDVLAYYLNYQFVPKPLKLTENSRNPVFRRFNFDYRDTPKILKQGEDELCDRLYDEFRKAIKKQLPSKGKPVGILLSGGMDSAAILHTLRDITDRTIYTLTGAYSKDAGHLISARRIAKRYNAIHHSLIIAPGSIKRIDELYRKKIPQPIGDNGFLSTYIMMGKLKEKVDHVISGDGADCLFSGLEMHRLIYLQRNSWDGTKSNNSKRDARYEHYKFGEIFLSEQELGFLFEKNCGDIKLEEPLENVINKIKAKDPIKKQVLLDLHFLVKNRVDYILYAAKASGVNVSLPYLDKDFVNFVLRIPSKTLMRSSVQQKYVLRKSFEGKLPQAVLNRKGEGFTPPFKLWYYENREYVITKLIRSKRLGISTEYIKKLIYESKKSNRYEMGMKIWLLLNLVSWYERIFKHPN